jgi:hypothetical protein
MGGQVPRGREGEGRSVSTRRYGFTYICWGVLDYRGVSHLMH